MNHWLGDHFTLDLNRGLGRGVARRDYLGCAVGNSTVFDDPLDQPVTIATTSRTRGDALGAQVVVTILANAAMIVAIRNRATTLVAINAEHAVGRVVGDDGELVLF